MVGSALGDLREQRLRARAALERAGTLAFKPVSSAKWTNVETLRTGAIRVQVEHDTLRGVTPQMMRWWFENVHGSTSWNGVDFSGPPVSHYHLWHHRDHIAVTPRPSGSDPVGVIAAGTTFTIDETFNDFHDRIHATVTTTRLDEQEFTFDIIKFGLRVGRIVHLYGPARGGLRFYAETTIGWNSGPLQIANLGRPVFYSARTAENWIRHNIEETGRSEDVIPQLYAHAMSG